jgi:hypothetical protein
MDEDLCFVFSGSCRAGRRVSYTPLLYLEANELGVTGYNSRRHVGNHDREDSASHSASSPVGLLVY